MSYFTKFNSNSWDFNDALNYYLDQQDGVLHSAVSKLSTDLNFQEGKTADSWRKNWKFMIANLDNKENERPPTTTTPAPAASSSNTINSGNFYFSGKSQQVNTIQSVPQTTSTRTFAKQDSFSSEDDMPTRTTKLTINTSNMSSESKVLDSEWITGDFNVSKYLLHVYRVKSIEYIVNKSHKELSLARRLSPHYIFYFPLKKEKSCICYKETQDIERIYTECKASIPAPIIPAIITTWAEEVKEVLDTDSDEFALDELIVKYLSESSTERCVYKRAAAYILSDIIHLNEQHAHSNAEDTFVHITIAPILRQIFYGPRLKTYWSNTQLNYSSMKTSTVTSTDESSPLSTPANETPSPTPTSPAAAPSTSSKRKYEEKKFQPDYILFASLFGHRYDLFVMEVKPPHSTMAIYDLPKLCKEMKQMLHNLVELGIESPCVCGLWVDGYSCKTYKMEIPHDGIYRMVQLADFDLPKDMNDLVKLRGIMKHMFVIKDIVLKTVKNIELMIRWKKDHLEEVASQINFDNIPQPSYLRDSAGRETRVKKTKRP